MSGLANCPFCGGQPQSYWQGASYPDDDSGYWAVECCHVHIHLDSEAEAIAAWNRRAAATPADVGEEPVLWQCEMADGAIRHFAAAFGEVHSCNGVPVVRRTPLYSATALERVTRERDEANELKAHARKCCDEAEAKLAEARKVIEELRTASEAFLALAEDGSRLHKAHSTSGRFLEETK